MTVYLDTLVILNTYTTWLMLSLTARLSHTPSKPLRTAIGAFLGGFSSLIMLLPAETAISQAFILVFKLSITALISASAFYSKPMSRKKLITVLLYFISINILFGGAVYLVKTLFKTSVIYFDNSTFYFDISLADLIFLTAVIYVAVVVFTHFTQRQADRNASYTVEIEVGQRSYTLEGTADTGNTVTDIFTGKPVIICTGTENDLPEGVKTLPVPYSTVNGEGLLYAFSPEAVYIQDDKGVKTVASALVAFSEGGVRRAVFNPKILYR